MEEINVSGIQVYYYLCLSKKVKALFVPLMTEAL